ncbi:MAG: helix-turn-helix domain-containing protein [Candidatus Gastranaerophilaceae bacterium]
MDEISAQQIGMIIKKFRKHAGFTQFELAELVGIDDKQIGKIERGIHYPSVPTFLKILKVLQIDIYKFYSGEIISVSENENKLMRLIRKLSPEQSEKIYKLIKVAISD